MKQVNVKLNTFTVNRMNLREQIAEKIQEMISTNHFQTGERLPSDREMAMLFNVSRPTLREALQLLEQRGLVRIQVGSGTYVMEMMPTSVADSFERFFLLKNCPREELLIMRGINEPEIAALAAQNATDEDLAKIKQYIDRLMEDSKNSHPMDPEIDCGFHQALAEASHNNLLIALSSALQKILRTWLNIQYENTRSDRKTNQEGMQVHLDIYKAVAARNPDQARQAARNIVNLAGRTMIKPVKAIKTIKSGKGEKKARIGTGV